MYDWNYLKKCTYVRREIKRRAITSLKRTRDVNMIGSQDELVNIYFD